jgi:predicted nucleotidyltransferase component of viral defense system
MFTKVIPKHAHSALAALGESGILSGTDAYLAGGTALALHLGHRISVDFDFFTAKSFDAQRLVRQLADLPSGFNLERTAPGTILGFVGDTKFSLFEYSYPLLEPTVQFENIIMAGIRDIAAMKLAAISDRGTRRDFIDLYTITAIKKAVTLDDVFGLYDKKFSVLHQNKIHLLKSLTYFQEADEDHMPEMLIDLSWPDIKNYYESEAKRISVVLLA